MSALNRIKQYIDFKKINVAKFEKSIGYSNGAFASQLKNKRSIGLDKLENILKVYPDLSPNWVLTGKGDMIVSDTKIYKVNEQSALYKTPALKGVLFEDQQMIDKKLNVLMDQHQTMLSELQKINDKLDTNFNDINTTIEDLEIAEKLKEVFDNFKKG